MPNPEAAFSLPTLIPKLRRFTIYGTRGSHHRLRARTPARANSDRPEKHRSGVRLAAHPRRCKRFDHHRNRHGTGRNFLLSSGDTSHWLGGHSGAAFIRLRSYASRRRTRFESTKQRLGLAHLRTVAIAHRHAIG